MYAQQPELADGTPQLICGPGRILHGELGEAVEAVRDRGHESCHLVVVTSTELDGRFGSQIGEERQRVGGQDLPVDAGGIHGGQAGAGIHERATAVADPDQAVLAHPKARKSPCGRITLVEVGALGPGRTERRFQHHVGVQIDHDEARSRAGPEAGRPPAQTRARVRTMRWEGWVTEAGP